MTYVPALSRTVRLPLTIPPNTTLRFPSKDPNDALDFSLDVTDFLNELSDTVTAVVVSTASTSSPALTFVQPVSPFGTLLTAKIGGGQINIDYPVNFAITTASGLTLNRTIWLYCQSQTADYGFFPPVTVLGGSGGGSGTSITNDPVATSMALTDSVGISTGGADHQITLTNLISSGSTAFGTVPAATAPGVNDTFLTDQNGTIGQQTNGALAGFVFGRASQYYDTTVEITTNINLNPAIHNKALLVCSQAVTISEGTSFVGSVFKCEIINLSTGNVVLGSGIITASGSNSIPPNGFADVYAFTYSGATNGAYYANFGGTGIPPVGLTIAVSNNSISVGQSVSVTGTINPSGTAVQIGYSTSNTTQPTSWASATVSGYGFTGVLSGFSAGTYYAWSRETGNTSITAVSGTPIAVSGGTGLTYSLITGSGNGSFATGGSMAGQALSTNGNAVDWASTITHGSTDIAPAVNLSLGQGTINSCKFWFDSSATNLTPGTYGTQAGFPGGTFVAFYSNALYATPTGAPAAPSTAGTYYGKYAFYDAGNTLMGVFATSAISII